MIAQSSSPSIALSAVRVARIFGFGLPGFRALLARGFFPGLRSPIKGSWLSIDARAAAVLLLVATARSAGFRGRRLRELALLVLAGLTERARTGCAPLLVLDPQAQTVRIFMAEGPTAALHPPAGVSVHDLAALESVFTAAIATEPPTPDEAERVLRAVVEALNMNSASAIQIPSPAAPVTAPEAVAPPPEVPA